MRMDTISTLTASMDEHPAHSQAKGKYQSRWELDEVGSSWGVRTFEGNPFGSSVGSSVGSSSFSLHVDLLTGVRPQDSFRQTLTSEAVGGDGERQFYPFLPLIRSFECRPALQTLAVFRFSCPGEVSMNRRTCCLARWVGVLGLL